MSLKYLTVEEILRLHFQVIEDFGGSHGVRDDSRLKSVVEAPALAVFDEEQYPVVFDKAAVYLRNIIGDHPFTDGNKRTALTVCAIFLARNEHPLVAKPDELEGFVLHVATNHLDITSIATWLKAHCR